MLLARNGYRVLLVDRATFPSDTISTHVVQPTGVGALRRWGLLDRLIATGCPPIHTYTFDFGPFAIAGSPGTDNTPVAHHRHPRTALGPGPHPRAHADHGRRRRPRQHRTPGSDARHHPGGATGRRTRDIPRTTTGEAGAHGPADPGLPRRRPGPEDHANAPPKVNRPAVSSDAPEPAVPKPLPATKEHRRRREHRRNRRTASSGSSRLRYR